MNPFNFGVDYYPEHWPEERWTTDARMMREAQINTVRLAEFAWAKLEPLEGQFDFSWLDRAIGALAQEGIRVILGTPTACAPKTLMDQDPAMYPVDFYGHTKGFGTRRHYCPTNAHYREHSVRIVRALAEHYQGHPQLIAWQVDNEFGGQCCCPNCRTAFGRWLENKYTTIGKLNDEWGTVFWSQTYQSFDQVPLPLYSSSDGFAQTSGTSPILSTPFNHNPGLLLDFYRFSSDSIIAFQQLQIDEIRRHSDLPITHNFMGHYSELDSFRLAEDLDFVSLDSYPNNMWGISDFRTVSMAHDLMRGLKNRNFWMMEQQSGPCGWHSLGDTPEPGQVRLWTYQSLAHGAEAMVYFRWRACTVGIEQYWYGILDHDGIGRRRYREIQQIGAELAGLGDLFVGAETRNEVALIKSYDNFWSHRAQPGNHGFDYNGLLQSYYNALEAHHVGVDVTRVETDFSSYKLVILPAFNLTTPAIGTRCEEYVRAGGTLLLTFRSGAKTWNNRMSEDIVPGCFRDLAGVEREEIDSLNGGRTVSIDGSFGPGTASVWCDVLKSTGAEVLATYTSHFYQGTPAVTVNRYGKGRVYYVACDLDAAAMEALLGLVTVELGVSPALVPEAKGLEVVRKFVSGKETLILMNHSERSLEVPVPDTSTVLLGGAIVRGLVTLERFGVTIVQP